MLTTVSYVRAFLATTFLILGAVAVLNYWMDPARIYRGGGIDPKKYAEALVQAPYGLWAPLDTFSERSIKKALAQHAGKNDRVVIGSSRCMGLGIKNSPKALGQGSLLNLAVSGAGIEDHLTLTVLSMNNQAPRRLILSIDPWTFAFGKDIRWADYAEDYHAARAEIFGSKKEESVPINSEVWGKAANLFSFAYTKKSLEKLIHVGREVETIVAAVPLNPMEGGHLPAYLQDGSYVYSSKSIGEFRSTPIPFGGISYKTDTPNNTPAGVQAYRALLVWIRSKGAEPVLMMTPYHENVWVAPNSPHVTAMRSTEARVLAFAREFNLSVIGSFDPTIAGVGKNDFYDFMHLNPLGLAKLKAHPAAKF